MSQPSSKQGLAAQETQEVKEQEVRQLFKGKEVTREKEFDMVQTSLQQGIAAQEIQKVKEQEVRQLFKPAEGIEAQAISGTGFTYRHDWGDRNGQWILTLEPWGVITNNTRVFVAIGEGAAGGGKFIGDARYTLHNVAPSNGRVSIWVNIEWSSPIRLYVDYLVINP